MSTSEQVRRSDGEASARPCQGANAGDPSRANMQQALTAAMEWMTQQNLPTPSEEVRQFMEHAIQNPNFRSMMERLAAK